RPRDRSPHPFVEISQNDAGSFQFLMIHNLVFEQAPRLLPVFQKRRPKMYIEYVERRTVHLDVRSQTAPRLAAPLGNVVMTVDVDREPAEHDVAVASAFQALRLA